MDFLRIRQKAKETAGAAPAAPPAPAVPAGPASPPVERPGVAAALASAAAAAGPASVPVPEPAPEPAAAPDRDPLDVFFWREDEVVEGLPEIVAASEGPGAREAAEGRTEWLTFLLGGEEYAVAIDQVREVLKAPVVTEVPRAPGHVLGVIMVRGEVIAIFDPRRRLGLPPAPSARAGRVLVCDTGDGPRGLLVDAVSQVVRLPPSAIEARPTGFGGANGEYITGIGREGDSLFILLDLSAVLRDATPIPPEAA